MRILIAFLLGFSLIARASDMTDFDGDGLPDVWEAAFGLRTNSAVGVDGPYGDPDCDGLSNLAEYRAGYYSIAGNIYSNAANAIAGLCPTNGHSVNAAVWDAYLRPEGASACLRRLYADGDFVDDSWESTNAVVSLDTWDDATVIGGRTAWDLCRSAFARRTQTVVAGVYYRGVREGQPAPVVFHFFGFPEMNGRPDAIASAACSGNWETPFVATLTNWAGTVRSGTNYVFAFLDLSGNGAWDAGEPCGVATPFGNDIGWDYNRINVQLTDYTPGYLRMDLSGKRSEDVISGAGASGGGASAATSALETRVRVYRRSVDSNNTWDYLALDKVIKSPRTYIHEGDFMGQGELALDWGLIDAPTDMNRQHLVYQVYIGDNELTTNNTLVAAFTNTFDVTADERAKAAANSPVSGKYVYSARPTFKWTMPDRYIAFAIEIKKGGTNGPTVYASVTLQCPVRDSSSSELIFSAPIYQGCAWTNGEYYVAGTSYWWRVIALNSKFTLTTAPIIWSDWNSYYQASSFSRPSAWGNMPLSICYASSYATGLVIAEAHRSASFTDDPVYKVSSPSDGSLTNMVSGFTNLVFRGIADGSYFVCSFLDSNTNGVRDLNEPWGYYNNFGASGIAPFDPQEVRILHNSSSSLPIVIENSTP
jgi:hypothetical protein